MAVGALSLRRKVEAFPRHAVEKTLRSVLLDSAKSTAAVKGIALPSHADAAYSARVSLDSLEVVDLLCEVEPIVGFELKDDIVRAGGYSSIDETVAHVLPKIEAAWQKHSNKGGTK